MRVSEGRVHLCAMQSKSILEQQKVGQLKIEVTRGWSVENFSKKTGVMVWMWQMVSIFNFFRYLCTINCAIDENDS